ncbi:hypothetical protein SLEP1_g18574 [Rubroshorea leprosula]|uniref:Glyoxal oxidase N-terminal domain-containing protein n=1 Tax=Rubroshorea leprosula TaxID=152421 RepID=A0AAV5J3H9_9ROSI|nr:hypothetical protein SLEP1_g18574 [Rubroshorea leprosula]
MFTSASGSSWELLQENVGIAAMQMELLNNDRVIMFDRTDSGRLISLYRMAIVGVTQMTRLQTDVWCSSGAVTADGRLIQTGGFNDGERRIRIFTPATTTVTSRKQFNYEFYPKNTAPGLFSLSFLSETNDRGVEDNLYPFVNLKNLQAPNIQAEVLICGRGANGSYTESLKKKLLPDLDTCARINITDPNPEWVMETKPLRRVLGDMILLPDSTVLIINSAASGSAGWEQGRDPVLSPVIYRPNNPIGSRFEVQSPTTIPRMYHSTAGLVHDGRVFVAGSNPHAYYNFTGVLFPTELRLEAFPPDHLNAQFDNIVRLSLRQ